MQTGTNPCAYILGIASVVVGILYMIYIGVIDIASSVKTCGHSSCVTIPSGGTDDASHQFTGTLA